MTMEENELDTQQMIKDHNRKKKKSGGFQAMGLSQSVFKGIFKKGYKVPTPIQRKTIPLILEGHDVVAMARTGSGKTAAFLVPLFEKLKTRTAIAGARALILSPTRELALQTQKFARDLGKFTGLKSFCILGGDSMERQFAALHENPDIIVATPGRFVHLCVEMGLKLTSVQYLVFDEADRLFEMGFGEQLREILGRLPDARQTVLFSATLPKQLVEFAKAGLTNPTLIRLDVDTKIPETLKLAFISCRSETKTALLLYLLQNVIPSDQQTILFAATRHHVEYLHLILDIADIPNTFIYSQLDSTARKINAAKFQTKKARVLIVTDLAARGIDIPFLDNVINFHFPAKSKLFVHRAGRCARAGRSGTAFSFVSGEELPYYIDLQLFLGNPLKTVPLNGSVDDWHNVLGAVPQAIHDEQMDQLRRWHDQSLDINNMKKASSNGYMMYLKSRPGASVESVKRVRDFKTETIGSHPLLTQTDDSNHERTNFLEDMKKFRPASTIFEIGNTSKSVTQKAIMSQKRSKHAVAIGRFHNKRADRQEAKETEDVQEKPLEDSSAADIEDAFSKVIQPKQSREIKMLTKKQVRRDFKDKDNFIGYQPKDHHTEAGYSMLQGFEAQASGAILDLTGDDDASIRRKNMTRVWDAKKKKYIQAGSQNQQKKIKTESGVWIPASYKSQRYEKWKERSKLDHMTEDNDGEEDGGTEQRMQRKRQFQGLPAGHPAMKKAMNALPKHKKGPKQEIKRPEQILKQRKLDDKKRFKNTKKSKRKGNRR